MKIFLSLMLAITASYLSAQSSLIKLKVPSTEFKIIAKSETSLKLINSISQCNIFTVKAKDKIFSMLEIEGYASNKDYGYPQLPVYNKLIDIPYGSDVQINIVSYDEEIIALSDYGITNKLIPAQPSMSKSANPDNVPFQFNEEYYKYNGFNNSVIADVDKLGIMRGVQIGRISIHPVRYNPVTNTIKIINNLIIEINFKHADIAKTNMLKQKYYSPLFNASLNKLANYSRVNTKDVFTQYPIKYVIVADTMFHDALQPFIQWKTRKGFNVVEAYTSNPAVGNTTTSIQLFLQNLYVAANAQNPAPSFVLFVGDIAQVPSFASTINTHVTDLYYCEYDGNGDYFPDAYYGRFSATTVAELQPQIDKTLEYEQYLMPDPSFLNEVVMIAGVDAGFAPIHGNGQINYGTTTYFNAAHNLLSHTYLYPTNSAASGQIHNDVSKGVGFVNYTAHGSPDGWADPSFSTADILTLTNDHKYPLMIGNCCLTSKFDEPSCFGESLLRASHKGAYAYIGGSNSSYWDEDFWWGTGAKTAVLNPTYDATKLGSYDCMFHENGEPDSSWFVTNGQMIHAGNLAVAEGGGAIQYYWEIYHLMGDPSTMNYFSVPPALSVLYNSALPLGLTTLDVTTEPNAYVAISYNNILLDAKLADNTGIVHLNFPAFTMAGTADLVATKQNRKPFIGTVSLIPNATPYVSYFSNVINDSIFNNNHLADYNENSNLNVTLKNIGLYDAVGVTASLSTTDTNVVITESSELYGNLTSGSSLTKNNAFALHVINKIEDQHSVLFNLTATDNAQTTWPSVFTIALNAPKLKVLAVLLDDSQGNSNGRLDPGEQAKIKIVVNNNGHAATTLPQSFLCTSNNNITIQNANIPLAILNPGAIDTVIYSISVASTTPFASTAMFTFIADAAPYSCQKIFSVSIGMIVEDWESNTTTHFPWINTSTVPWTIDTDTVYEGSYSLKSGNISDQQNTDIVLGVNVLMADSVSFYYRISSENSYDFLHFYIDGIEANKWSGEQNWSRAAFPISAGSHSLKWSYSKDYSVSGGSDCARIDFISFPQLDMQTGIENQTKLNEFMVFPTAASTFSTVQFTTLKTDKISLKLVNALGQNVRSFISNEELNSGTHELQISLQNISSGVYYLNLISNNKTHIRKIVVTN